MSTEAQIAANRHNAQSSTGPATAEGKARAARNSTTLGLFTMADFVRPGESAEHQIFCAEFWLELNPGGPVEETYAAEIIRAAWRLRRCGLLDAELAESPAETPEQNEANRKTQIAIDRARAQANNIFRRAHSDLRRLQASRPAAENSSHVAEPAPPVTNRTQSAPALIPGSAPCPCGSGEKYKRCCGRNAPAVLNLAA